jgi:hypothetical protein
MIFKIILFIDLIAGKELRREIHTVTATEKSENHEKPLIISLF